LVRIRVVTGGSRKCELRVRTGRADPAPAHHPALGRLIRTGRQHRSTKSQSTTSIWLNGKAFNHHLALAMVWTGSVSDGSGLALAQASRLSLATLTKDAENTGWLDGRLRRPVHGSLEPNRRGGITADCVDKLGALTSRCPSPVI